MDAFDGYVLPIGILDYPGQHALALCQGLFNCCPQDAGSLDGGACQAAFSVGGWDNTTLPLDLTIFDAGKMYFNPSQASLCIAALQAAPCGASGQLTATQYATITNRCLGVLSGAISIGLGGCTSSWECAPGAWCNMSEDGGAGTGVCDALVAVGGACTLDEMCSSVGTQQPETFCNLVGTDGGVESTGTCQAVLANGVQCGDLNSGFFDDQACAARLCGDPFTCGTPVTIPSAGFCAAY